MVFIDGQNLYQAAKQAFGYTHPNFDPIKLAERICRDQRWVVRSTYDFIPRIRFYTGLPEERDNPRWQRFWMKKLGVLGRRKSEITVTTRPVRYRNRVVTLPDGSTVTARMGEEKGIDVRIALDAISLLHRGEYDVALFLSQDQDLQEVTDEIRCVARQQKRWVKVASAFPIGPGTTNHRGINRTDWIPIEKTVYDDCVDPRDYRRDPTNGKQRLVD